MTEGAKDVAVAAAPAAPTSAPGSSVPAGLSGMASGVGNASFGAMLGGAPAGAALARSPSPPPPSAADSPEVAAIASGLALAAGERRLARSGEPAPAKGPGWAAKAPIKIGIDPFGENPSLEVGPGEALNPFLKRKLGAVKGQGLVNDGNLINKEWPFPIPALPGLMGRIHVKAGLGVEAGIEPKLSLKRDEAVGPTVHPAIDTMTASGMGYVKGFAEGFIKGGIAVGAPGMNLSMNLGAGATFDAKAEAGISFTATRTGDPDKGEWSDWSGSGAFQGSLSVQLKVAATGSIDWKVGNEDGVLVEIKLYEWTALDGQVPIKVTVGADGTVTDDSPKPALNFLPPPPPKWWPGDGASAIKKAQMAAAKARQEAERSLPGPRQAHLDPDVDDGSGGAGGGSNAAPGDGGEGGAGQGGAVDPGPAGQSAQGGQGGAGHGAGPADDGGGGARGASGAGSQIEESKPIANSA